MIQKIKTLLLSLSLVLALGLPALAPAVASAASTTIQNSVCSGAGQLNLDNSTTCEASTSGSTSNFDRILTDIINIFSVIVGIIAVIMIIVGGFRYITSGGASDKVTSAKNTLLYAIVGLIVVALAQIIVQFVLNKATQ